jgi:hypothetical protein
MLRRPLPIAVDNASASSAYRNPAPIDLARLFPTFFPQSNVLVTGFANAAPERHPEADRAAHRGRASGGADA